VKKSIVVIITSHVDSSCVDVLFPRYLLVDDGRRM